MMNWNEPEKRAERPILSLWSDSLKHPDMSSLASNSEQCSKNECLYSISGTLARYQIIVF